MARLSKEARFEKRTQDRRDAVKHMRERVACLKKAYSNTQSLKDQDAISDKIDFLTDVIARTNGNLHPKRRQSAKSVAQHVSTSPDENVHLYDNEHSSFAGVDALLSTAS